MKAGAKLKMALADSDKSGKSDYTKVASSYAKPGSKLKSFGKSKKAVD